MKTMLRGAALAGIAACAACSNGSSTLTPVRVATPTPTPTPVAATPSPSPAPTGTPSPTPAPTATPTPASPQSSVSSIAFSSNAPVTFTVSQSGYTGGFTESDTCSPLSGTIASVVANANSSPASYTVTPVGAGTCTITISNAAGGAVPIGVTVSTAAITVQ